MVKILKLYALILFTSTLAGCVSNTPSLKGQYNSIEGISSYIKTVKGISNLVSEYPDGPILTKNDPENLYKFNRDAMEYIEAIRNDMKLIDKHAENANKKINAAIDSAEGPLKYYSINHIGDPLLLFDRYPSNLGFISFLRYPIFPDFDEEPFPTFMDFNNPYLIKLEILSFFESLEDYIEDGEHYLKNCKNDYNMIKIKGENYIEYFSNVINFDIYKTIDPL